MVEAGNQVEHCKDQFASRHEQLYGQRRAV